MENDNLTSVHLAEQLLQWAIFFAILTIFWLPAFKFRSLAMEYGKKGWVYFFVGLAVGAVGYSLGQLVVLPLRYYGIPPEYGVYAIAIIILCAYLFYRLSYRFLRNQFIRNAK